MHPTARTWAEAPLPGDLPPGARATHLRALLAREGRFEHHLMVVARVGVAQLEAVCASEPLFFAHANVSDEWVLPLRTGDPLLDHAPLRVFLSDPETHRDVGRINHRVGDAVLHPHGWLHWPGRLRPPFSPPAFPPGQRRALPSVAFCASRPTPPAPDRPVPITRGREEDAKAYVDPPPPLGLVSLDALDARVGDATLTWREPPFAPPRGGYVLRPDGALVYLPPGVSLDLDAPALLLASDTEAAAPPPATWDRVPEAPFPPYELADPGALPVSVGGLRAEAVDEDTVRLDLAESSAQVPRHWLARMLFRIALHTLVVDGAKRPLPTTGFGYVETYGGFFYDDRDGAHRVGLRDGDSVVIPPGDLSSTLEALYRAVAPRGYVEDVR
ncbi:MAG: hypothetical protein RLO52_21130 [Sandaracinaceae bacterium]